MRVSREEPVVFDCAGDQLVGILHSAEDPAPRIGVLVVVGGPQYRVGSHRQFTLMARSFAAAGYPVFRFDYRGMGDSEGETRSFETVDEDIRAAIDVFLAALPSLTGIVLWGLCDGASAILLGGSGHPRVAGLILVNPWVRSEAGEAKAYIKHYYWRRLLQASFWSKVFSRHFRGLKAIRDFLRTFRSATSRRVIGDGESLTSYVERMRCGLESFEGPALVLTSERDLTAGEFLDLVSSDPVWSQAIRASGSVASVTLDDADHTFSSRETLEAATDACLAWLKELGPREAGWRPALGASSSQTGDMKV